MADFTDVQSLPVQVPNKFLADEGGIDTLMVPVPNAYSISGASPDTTPPFVASYSPVGGVINPAQIITIEVEDDQDLDNGAGGIVLIAYYIGESVQEVIYNGSAFVGQYTGTAIQTTPPPGEVIEFQIQRVGGWFASPMQIIVNARDVEGNFAADNESYTLDPDPTPQPPDPTPPVVSNFDPPEGTEVLATQAIQFDVTDNTGSFARILVVAWFRDTGEQELIHDGDNFVGLYSSTSSRVIITDGYRYVVARSGGWENAPTIRVFPIDAAGNEPV